MFNRFRSAESVEKKLPKPLYIILAVISLLVISLVGFYITRLFEYLSIYADNVLKLYL